MFLTTANVLGSSPRGAKRPPKRSKGNQKGTRKIHKAIQRHPKSRPKGPSGTPLGTKDAPREPRYTHTFKTIQFLKSLLERFQGQVHMQSAHACAFQTPKITIYSSLFFHHFLSKRWNCTWNREGGTRDPTRKRGELGLGTQAGNEQSWI